MHASIEFLCGGAIDDSEPMCVPIAVTELSLADLIGYPRLLECSQHDDGRVELRYGLSGRLCPHHETPRSALGTDVS